MQPDGVGWLNAGTTRLLPRCSHNEGVGSIRPQRDCCLDTQTTSLLPRCNEMRLFDAVTTKGLARSGHNKRLVPRCSHKKCAANEFVASKQPERDIATTRLMTRCSHNERVGLMVSEQDSCLNAATMKLLPLCSHNVVVALVQRQ